MLRYVEWKLRGVWISNSFILICFMVSQKEGLQMEKTKTKFQRMLAFFLLIFKILAECIEIRCAVQSLNCFESSI